MSTSDLRTARRVCFFAHYDRDGIIGDHVLLYLDALREAGFATVVVSTAALDQAAQVRLRGHCHTLVMRENVGLDFGSWAEAVRRFLPVDAEFLLLANDSVYAPVGSLPAFLERLTAVPADVYGAVESREVAPHLQSWFVLLRPRAYRSAVFRAFITRAIDPALSKHEIVVSREVGLSQVLRQGGFVTHVAYTGGQGGPVARRWGLNPTHQLWDRLIENGIPFLKVELLRLDPAGVASAAHWRAVVQPRNPVLAEAIAADLDRFGTPPPRSLIRRLDASIMHPPTYWPEMRGFLVRDHRLRPGSAASRMNSAVFHLLLVAGTIVRRPLRLLRRLRRA